MNLNYLDSFPYLQLVINPELSKKKEKLYVVINVESFNSIEKDFYEEIIYIIKKDYNVNLKIFLKSLNIDLEKNNKTLNEILDDINKYSKYKYKKYLLNIIDKFINFAIENMKNGEKNIDKIIMNEKLKTFLRNLIFNSKINLKETKCGRIEIFVKKQPTFVICTVVSFYPKTSELIVRFTNGVQVNIKLNFAKIYDETQ